MSEVMHTPGPWEICQMTEDDGPRHLAVRRLNQARRAVCLVSGLSTVDEEDEANAALIAAAPDLLAAIRGWLAIFNTERAYVSPLVQAAIRESLAAIAKAEGL